MNRLTSGLSRHEGKGRGATNYFAGYISRLFLCNDTILLSSIKIFLLSSASELYWLHLGSWQGMSPEIWAAFSCAPALLVLWEAMDNILCTGYAMLKEPAYS